jgi:small ligand-binding sensory domain FIST
LNLPETADPAEIAALAVVGEALPSKLHEEYGSPFIVRGGPLKDDSGAIYLTGNSQAGTRLWLMRRDEQGIFDGVDRLVQRLLDRCGARRPVAVFHADCAARGRMSFDRIHKEEIIRRIQEPIIGGLDIPWLGMYGGGELTMLGGENRIHVYTTSLYLIVKKDDQAAN